MSSPGRIYNYRWDAPDYRDAAFRFAAVQPRLKAALPASIDLRPQCPPVWDQGDLGSCTAHAVCAALAFDRKKQGLTEWDISRLYEYYFTRVLAGDVSYDGGGSLRQACKTAATYGYIPETEWPYDVSQFKRRPPQKLANEGRTRAAIQYMAVTQKLASLQGALARGFIVPFGISIFDSFEGDKVAKTGVVPMPGPGESNQGGHAIDLVGYSNSTGRFRFRNSWGTDWGQKGYGELPYAYVTSAGLASDFWSIEHVPS
jgi:C1A family cysteine protease